MMAHYKKRLIHQLELEKPEDNCEITKEITKDDTNSLNGEIDNVLQDSQSSDDHEELMSPYKLESQPAQVPLTLSEFSSKIVETRKKDIIQKLVRRKSVSRTHFRHDNIELFKPGKSIHERNSRKEISINVNSENLSDKSVPKESLTADIIQAIDGNKSPPNRKKVSFLLGEDAKKKLEPLIIRTTSIKEKKERKESKSRKKSERIHKDKSDKHDGHRSETKESDSSSRKKSHKSKKKSDKTEKHSEKRSGRKRKRDKYNDESHLSSSETTSGTLELLREQENESLNCKKEGNEKQEEEIKDEDTELQNKNLENNAEEINEQNETQQSNKPQNEEEKKENNNLALDLNSDPNNTRGTGIESTQLTDVTIKTSQDATAASSPKLAPPLLNIPFTSADGISSISSIQIRICDPVNNVEVSKNEEIDLIDNYLRLAQSMMEGKFCQRVLRVLQYYYKHFCQKLASDVSEKYKLTMQETMCGVVVYVKKGLFGNNPNPELMIYAKDILESNFKDHEDFFDVHLGILHEKCNDPIWMEQFIKTISQSKQNIGNENTQSSHNKKIRPENEIGNINIPTSNKNVNPITNNTILNDYYNLKSVAKVSESLQMFQSNQTAHGRAPVLPAPNMLVPEGNRILPNLSQQSLIINNPLNNISMNKEGILPNLLEKTNHMRQHFSEAELFHSLQRNSEKPKPHINYQASRTATSEQLPFTTVNQNYLVPELDRSAYFNAGNGNATVTRLHPENMHPNNMATFPPSPYIHTAPPHTMNNVYPPGPVKEVNNAGSFFPNMRFNQLDPRFSEQLYHFNNNRQTEQRELGQVAPAVSNTLPVSSPTVTTTYPTEGPIHDLVMLQNREASKMIATGNMNRINVYPNEPSRLGTLHEVAKKYPEYYTNTTSIAQTTSHYDPRMYYQGQRDVTNQIVTKSHVPTKPKNVKAGTKRNKTMKNPPPYRAESLVQPQKSTATTCGGPINSQNQSIFVPPRPVPYPQNQIINTQHPVNDTRKVNQTLFYVPALHPPATTTGTKNKETTTSKPVHFSQTNHNDIRKRSLESCDEVQDLSIRKKMDNNSDKQDNAQYVIFTQKLSATAPLKHSIKEITSSAKITERKSSSAHFGRSDATVQESAPQFDFLQEIRSPSPERVPEPNLKEREIDIHHKDIHTDQQTEKHTNVEDNPASVQMSVEVPDQSAPDVAVNEAQQNSEIIRETQAEETMDESDAVTQPEEDLVLHDDSMKITKTTKNVKEETEEDVLELLEDKKTILDFCKNLHKSRSQKMVDILKGHSAQIFNAIRTIYDFEKCGNAILNPTDVITIDDDDEDDDIIEITSPESTTIEKVTEESGEEVPSKRLKLNDDSSSSSTILLPEQEVKPVIAPKPEIEMKRVEVKPIQNVGMVKKLDKIPQNTTSANSFIQSIEKHLQTILAPLANFNRALNQKVLAEQITASLAANGIEKVTLLVRQKKGLTPPKIESHHSPSANSQKCCAASNSSDNVSPALRDPPVGEVGADASNTQNSSVTDLTTDDDVSVNILNSIFKYKPLSPLDCEHVTAVIGTKCDRQELVSRPIHNDLTPAQWATKSTYPTDLTYSSSSNTRRNQQKLAKSRRHSVESRSSFSDASSPSPSEDIATVTIGSSSFNIKKIFLEYIPKGKLYYKKDTNTFVQCYPNGETRNLQIVNEHQLPKKWIFTKEADFSDAARFAEEFEKVQKFVPKDFSFYYKFVTGYQIFHHKKPISFRTFLEMHNGDRMDTFFVKYLAHLQKFSSSGINNPEEWKVT